MVNEVSDLCQDPTGPVWRDTQNPGLLRDWGEGGGGALRPGAFSTLMPAVISKVLHVFLLMLHIFVWACSGRGLFIPSYPIVGVSDSMAHLTCNFCKCLNQSVLARALFPSVSHGRLLLGGCIPPILLLTGF